MADIWELVAGTEHAVRDFTALQKGVRHTERITADLQRQLDWLLRPRFLWAHGAERLPDLKRYMQGIAERIRRIGQQPLARELERLVSLNACISLASGFEGTCRRPALDAIRLFAGRIPPGRFRSRHLRQGPRLRKRLVASFEALSSQ